MRTNISGILFPLGLLVFTTFACKHDAIDTRTNDTQTNNVLETSTVSQKQNSLSKDASTTQTKQSKGLPRNKIYFYKNDNHSFGEK